MTPANTEKVLVIAPHADDAEFGLGGYMARMLRENVSEPTVGIIAGGDYLGRHGQTVFDDERRLESTLALRHLGVTAGRVHTLGTVPENEFDLVGQKVLMDQVDMLLMKGDFTEVFINLPSHNQDHLALYRACIACFRPGRWETVKRIWAYEYPGHNIDNHQPPGGRCYVKLTHKDILLKLKALNAHKTQFEGKLPNHCGPNGAHDLAKLRGSECGAEFAELFWLVREIY